MTWKVPNPQAFGGQLMVAFRDLARYIGTLETRVTTLQPSASQAVLGSNYTVTTTPTDIGLGPLSVDVPEAGGDVVVTFSVDVNVSVAGVGTISVRLVEDGSSVDNRVLFSPASTGRVVTSKTVVRSFPSGGTHTFALDAFKSAGAGTGVLGNTYTIMTAVVVPTA